MASAAPDALVNFFVEDGTPVTLPASDIAKYPYSYLADCASESKLTGTAALPVSLEVFNIIAQFLATGEAMDTPPHLCTKLSHAFAQLGLTSDLPEKAIHTDLGHSEPPPAYSTCSNAPVSTHEKKDSAASWRFPGFASEFVRDNIMPAMPPHLWGAVVDRQPYAATVVLVHRTQDEIRNSWEAPAKTEFIISNAGDKMKVVQVQSLPDGNDVNELKREVENEMQAMETGLVGKAFSGKLKVEVSKEKISKRDVSAMGLYESSEVDAVVVRVQMTRAPM